MQEHLATMGIQWWIATRWRRPVSGDTWSTAQSDPTTRGCGKRGSESTLLLLFFFFLWILQQNPSFFYMIQSRPISSSLSRKHKRTKIKVKRPPFSPRDPHHTQKNPKLPSPHRFPLQKPRSKRFFFSLLMVMKTHIYHLFSFSSKTEPSPQRSTPILTTAQWCRSNDLLFLGNTYPVSNDCFSGIWGQQQQI